MLHSRNAVVSKQAGGRRTISSMFEGCLGKKTAFLHVASLVRSGSFQRAKKDRGREALMTLLDMNFFSIT